MRLLSLFTTLVALLGSARAAHVDVEVSDDFVDLGGLDEVGAEVARRALDRDASAASSLVAEGPTEVSSTPIDGARVSVATPAVEDRNAGLRPVGSVSPTDPWKCWDAGWTRCEVTSERLKYVHRGGKWYRSSLSNDYWVNGTWSHEAVAPHPNDPNVQKLAGKFVLKAPAYRDDAWVHKMDRWWKAADSRHYYHNGTWTVARDRNATDPRGYLVGGEWKLRTDLSGAELQWVRRQVGPTVTVWCQDNSCVRHWVDGRWQLTPSAREHMNNPAYWNKRYENKRTGEFVRDESAATHRFAKKRGLWYKSLASPFYYLGGEWYREAPQNRDPRYRPRFDRPCGSQNATAMAECQKAKWAVVPAARWRSSWQYDVREDKWFENETHRRYYWYGRWETDVEAVEEDQAKIRRQRWRDRRRDYNRIVDKTSYAVFDQFSQWYEARVKAAERLAREMKAHAAPQHIGYPGGKQSDPGMAEVRAPKPLE